LTDSRAAAATYVDLIGIEGVAIWRKSIHVILPKEQKPQMNHRLDTTYYRALPMVQSVIGIGSVISIKD
jgi:hypothetical protein